MSTVPAHGISFADDFSTYTPSISREKQFLDWKARIPLAQPQEAGESSSWVKEACQNPLDTYSKAHILLLDVLASSAWDYVFLILLFVWVALTASAFDAHHPVDSTNQTLISVLMVLSTMLQIVAALYFGIMQSELLLLRSIDHVTTWVSTEATLTGRIWVKAIVQAISFVLTARAICFVRERYTLPSLKLKWCGGCGFWRNQRRIHIDTQEQASHDEVIPTERPPVTVPPLTQIQQLLEADVELGR